MVCKQRWFGLVSGVLFVAATSSALQAEVLIPAGSTWKWHHSSEGVDPADGDDDFHTTFYLASFDDSAWTSGQDKAGPHGGFGYGDPDFDGVDIGRPEERDNRKTAYFRISFKTESDFEELMLKCQRDDSIIVYLDGKEVLRDNLGDDAKEAHDLFANEVVSGEGETEVNEFPFELELPAGDHVLAISVHNRPGGSSDLRIAEISLESVDVDTDE